MNHITLIQNYVMIYETGDINFVNTFLFIAFSLRSVIGGEYNINYEV